MKKFKKPLEDIVIDKIAKKDSNKAPLSTRNSSKLSGSISNKEELKEDNSSRKKERFKSQKELNVKDYQYNNLDSSSSMNNEPYQEAQVIKRNFRKRVRSNKMNEYFSKNRASF